VLDGEACEALKGTHPWRTPTLMTS
jgi:hypothetical protein